MKCKHWENNHIEKKGTNCNVNDTGISDNQPAFSFVISKNYMSKNIDPTYGFQPPKHQVNANIYIDNFFPRRLITE